MPPEVLDAIPTLFPAPEHAGIRHRCRLAIGMGYSVTVVASWITCGMPQDTTHAWHAAHLPQLAQLAALVEWKE